MTRPSEPASLKKIVSPISRSNQLSLVPEIQMNFMSPSPIYAGILCRSCVTDFSWGDATYMSAYLRKGAHNRPKSNLINQRILLELLTGIWGNGYLEKQKLLKDSFITKAHYIVNDSSQKLKTWSTLHSLQQLSRLETPFQVAQLCEPLPHRLT